LSVTRRSIGPARIRGIFGIRPARLSIRAAHFHLLLLAVLPLLSTPKRESSSKLRIKICRQFIWLCPRHTSSGSPLNPGRIQTKHLDLAVKSDVASCIGFIVRTRVSGKFLRKKFEDGKSTRRKLGYGNSARLISAAIVVRSAGISSAPAFNLPSRLEIGWPIQSFNRKVP